MSFYLDTSVLVPLQVEEAQSEVVSVWLRDVEGLVHISDLAAAEFGAAISREVRTGALAANEADAIMARFDAWRDEVAEPVDIVNADARMAVRLVRDPWPKLLTPDALHIAICYRLGLTLAAHDRDLITVAKRIGVESIYPA